MPINWEPIRGSLAAAAASIDGKKTYYAAQAIVLVNTLAALKIKPFVDQSLQWTALATIVLGILVILFRALSRTPGFLVKKTPSAALAVEVKHDAADLAEKVAGVSARIEEEKKP